MTATSNPAAIALIDEMIADTERDIKLTESNITSALTSLHSRYTEVAVALEAGNGIYETGVQEAAIKVEKYVAQRTAQYANLSALRYTRKAAGGE